MLDICDTTALLNSLSITFVYGVIFNIYSNYPTLLTNETIGSLQTIIFTRLQKLQNIKVSGIINLNASIGVQSIVNILQKDILKDKLSSRYKFKVSIKNLIAHKLITHTMVAVVSVTGTVFFVQKQRGGDRMVWFLWKCLGKWKGWK